MATSKGIAHRTTITIENYSLYNDFQPTIETTSNTTSGEQAHTTNKDNKRNKIFMPPM